MRWTKEQFDEYQRKRANSKTGAIGLPATDSQPVKGHTLERVAPRKEKSGNSPVVSPEPRRRKRIRFTVYAVRPADYDNWHTKEIQDLLVHAGILDDDKWDILQGEVISEKIHKKEDERTEILIEQL